MTNRRRGAGHCHVVAHVAMIFFLKLIERQRWNHQMTFFAIVLLGPRPEEAPPIYKDVFAAGQEHRIEMIVVEPSFSY